MSTTSHKLADVRKQRTSFIMQARQAKAEMLENGNGHTAEDVRTYLRQRLEDGQIGRPGKKSWRE